MGQSRLQKKYKLLQNSIQFVLIQWREVPFHALNYIYKNKYGHTFSTTTKIRKARKKLEREIEAEWQRKQKKEEREIVNF